MNHRVRVVKRSEVLRLRYQDLFSALFGCVVTGVLKVPRLLVPNSSNEAQKRNPTRIIK
jgi:hypothetical protein